MGAHTCRHTGTQLRHNTWTFKVTNRQTDTNRVTIKHTNIAGDLYKDIKTGMNNKGLMRKSLCRG